MQHTCIVMYYYTCKLLLVHSNNIIIWPLAYDMDKILYYKYNAILTIWGVCAHTTTSKNINGI